MTTIEKGPHYTIQSRDLARWLETYAKDSWWNVDGDPLLTGRVDFPCPSDELIPELKRINKRLLVQAKKGDNEATGQPIDSQHLNDVVARLRDNVHVTGPEPDWADDRFFYLAWENSPYEWMLAEDLASLNQAKEAAEAH